MKKKALIVGLVSVAVVIALYFVFADNQLETVELTEFESCLASSDWHVNQTEVANCYYAEAIRTENSSICGDIFENYLDLSSFQTANCYRNYAYEKNDISACRKAGGSPYTIAQCRIAVEKAAGAEDYCATAGGTLLNPSKESDDCYIQRAIEENDVSFCEKIVSTTRKEECFAEFE